MSVSEKIKNRRKVFNLSPETVARRAGLSVRLYEKYENGKTPVTMYVLEKIAYGLGVDAVDLIPENQVLEEGSLTINGYQKKALRTASHVNVLEAAMGLAGEAGECADLVKKNLFQGHDLDVDHFAKELGDVAWYLALGASAIGYPLEDILKMNIDKLYRRYPYGFDPDKSQNRAEGDV